MHSSRRIHADATWIPSRDSLDTCPEALRRQLLASDDGCELPGLDLVPAARVARPASGPDDALSLRRRFGRLARQAQATGRFVLDCEPAWNADQLRQAVLGLAQGAYRFDRYRSEEAPAPARLDLRHASSAQRPGLEQARVLADAVRLCRDLINTPAQDLGPAEFVRAARTACRGTGLRLRVLEAAACRSAGLGCLLAVGRASHRPPRLLVVEWPGRHKRMPARDVPALCGKGVCFDTGGLNIKTGKSMSLMRKDMGGAATVLAAMLACARLRGPEPVRAYLPLVENAIGPDAMRPGDVLTAADGTTVEVGNTDAEGRLILADAICLARQDDSSSITTVATLTGAALVALGRIHVPVMGDDAPVERLLEGGATTGEKCWRLPLDEEHAAIMQGEIADLRNDGNGEAGCITAGAFLRHFAGDTPFAHCDISPASWQPAPHDLGPAGATGVFVSTLVHALGGLGRAD